MSPSVSLSRLAREEVPGQLEVEIVQSDTVTQTISQYAADHDQPMTVIGDGT